MDQMNGVPVDPTWWSNLGYAVGGVFAAIGGRKFLTRRHLPEERPLTCTDVVAAIDKMSDNLSRMMDLMSNEFSNEIHKTREEFRTRTDQTANTLGKLVTDTAILIDRSQHPPGG